VPVDSLVNQVNSEFDFAQVRDVYLQGNDLAQRFAALRAGESFCIGETKFASGLNFLSAWLLFEHVAPQGASLDFFSIENTPSTHAELAISQWPELRVQANALQTNWLRRVPGWNRWSFAGGRVRLTLIMSDVVAALPQLSASCVDAWFLDISVLEKSHDKEGVNVCENIIRASRVGATLAMPSNTPQLAEQLQQAGFEVELLQDAEPQQKMLRGSLNQRVSSRANSMPRSALLIGAGIAGCAAAYALAQRGIRVTLVDRAPQLASGASGNSRGILHARFGAGDNPLHRFVLAAYGHVLGLLDAVLAVDGVLRSECGLLQLACKEVESKRIARLAQQDWPAHVLQFVDAGQASRRAGMAMRYGGLWFPAGGWVIPASLCEALVDNELITQRLGHEIDELEKVGATWRVSGHDAQGETWDADADIVVVCCAHAAKQLAQFTHFPLIPVRGQITELSETMASKTMQSVVCGDGYCAPAVNGVHVMGATHAFDDKSIEVREADHAENLAKLAEYAPALFQSLNSCDTAGRHSREGGNLVENTNPRSGQSVDSDALRVDSLTNWIPAFAGMTQEVTGRASIRCSAPSSMPLVGLVQQGLYCSLAHGTRGLLTAGISGEILAAQICGELPPLPINILAELNPLARIRNKS